MSLKSRRSELSKSTTSVCTTRYQSSSEVIKIEKVRFDGTTRILWFSTGTNKLNAQSRSAVRSIPFLILFDTCAGTYLVSKAGIPPSSQDETMRSKRCAFAYSKQSTVSTWKSRVAACTNRRSGSTFLIWRYNRSCTRYASGNVFHELPCSWYLPFSAKIETQVLESCSHQLFTVQEGIKVKCLVSAKGILSVKKSSNQIRLPVASEQWPYQDRNHLYLSCAQQPAFKSSSKSKLITWKSEEVSYFRQVRSKYPFRSNLSRLNA